MKFSFIIPVHNVERYLEKCLQSILNWKNSDYEIILINDGSTDNSGYICDNYKQQYPQIKVIHQEQKGLSEARNVGIQTAKGEYFLLVDSDDIIFSDKLDMLQDKCKEEPDIIAFQNTLFEKDEMKKNCQPDYIITKTVPDKCNGREFLEIVLQDAVENAKFYQWSAWLYCYKRDFFIKYDFKYPKGRNFEDLSLTWRVLLKAECVMYLSEIIYGYRKNVNGSITRTYDYKNVNDRLMSVIGNMQALKENKEISEELKSCLADHFSEHYFIVLTMSDLPATHKQRKKLMKTLKENVWITECSLRNNERFLAKLIKIFGISVVCKMLHIRRKIVYHGQFKRSY